MAESSLYANQAVDENKRLAELRALDILDTPQEVRFDRYTHLVSQIFKVPIAIISLVEEDRQWFKSSVGVKVRETSLEESFCVHALKRDMLEIPDTLEDDFFRHHKSVVSSPFIRFYAGTVLRGPTGQPLGTLCIVDMSPRYLTDTERHRLITFGHLVEELIKHQARLAIVRQRLKQLRRRNPRTGHDEMLIGDTIANLIRLAEKDDNFLAMLEFERLALCFRRSLD